MPINYDLFQTGSSIDTVSDPQKLFQALPAKDKKYAYLRDVQGDVLAKWHSSPKRKDTIIKMNTGAGKTVVGLLILKASLNEGLGPAVYLCPDWYLCEQVEKEAKSLGLATTREPRSADYQSGKAILVIPTSVLVNGLSKFGVGAEVLIHIGTIAVDDAHACIAESEEKFSLNAPRESVVYGELFKLFEADLTTQSMVTTQEIKIGETGSFVQVPYWAWADKLQHVIGVLSRNLPEDNKKFTWPIIKDDLLLCRCFFSTKFVEVSSRCLPIHQIPSFDEAKRRIYMTATLADDSILVTDFSANPVLLKESISPKTASDLGERMILVPQEINTNILDLQLKSFVSSYAKSENVVVIVPSKARATSFWGDAVSSDLILTADNLSKGIDRLKASKGQLAVLVNKYDGIDLPDDACRLLVIDGLPDTRRLADKYEKGVLGTADRFLAKQVQKIEQGMGRGIRSNEDYCAVILMGKQLLQALYGVGAVRHFSPATKRQLELSRAVAEQLRQQGLDKLREPIGDLLARDPGWVGAAKNSLIDVVYSDQVIMDPLALAQRAAYDLSRIGNFQEAAQVLRRASRSETDMRVEGWILEQVAEVIHHFDKADSQKVLSVARAKNFRVAKPREGIAYKKLDLIGLDQARQASSFLCSTYPDGGNSVVIGVAGVLDNLVFREEGADEFEQALKEVGLHLGFSAQRPEKEGGGKLDVLWNIGSSEYVLLPCKSEASSTTIAKKYTDQISGNLNWFRQAYGQGCTAYPIMVHPSKVLDADAAAPPDMKVMSADELLAFRDAVQAFVSAIKDRLDDLAYIRESLNVNGLLGGQFVRRYSGEPLKKT